MKRVIYIGMENDIWEPNSNSWLVFWVHFLANTLGKGMIMPLPATSQVLYRNQSRRRNTLKYSEIQNCGEGNGKPLQVLSQESMTVCR